MATAGIRHCRKPHFFKPILPPFQQLSIPRAFLTHLVDEMCEEGVGEATLKNYNRCDRKSWRVKVKGFCFTEGWDGFVSDNDLGFGDLLVFRYEGAMVFDVQVFDRSCCEKQYHNPPSTPIERETQKHQDRANDRVNEDEVKRSASSNPRRGGVTKATKDSFEVLLTKNNTKRSRAAIPKDFARANGLMGKIFDAIFRDEKGRSWPVRLNQDSGRIRIGGGWLEFLSRNCLKEGDSCVFKLVSCEKIRKGTANAIVLDVTVSSSSSSSLSSSSSSSSSDGDGWDLC